MKFGSVCSGIEAATVAWESMWWDAQWLSEIEKFPSAVLAYHYPEILNLGDMTKLYDNDIFLRSQIDLLVGGTPCQSFSVAGLRKGLDDPRGNLCLEFLRLVDIKKPKWFLWENVPGVLSSSGGRDFGSFLGAIQKLGYGFAYRILDAKYFGIPQRRRRVFVVGYLGDWRPAAAVLFESESLCGNLTPSRKKRKGITRATEISLGSGSKPIDFRNLKFHEGDVSGTIQAKKSGGYSLNYTTGILLSSTDDIGPLTIGSRSGGGQHAIGAFKQGNGAKSGSIGRDEKVSPTLNSADSGTNRTPALLHKSYVRRLTPVECERLQGFPDNYTMLPGNKADGPRYKALGNSMAVPVMRWIGNRIQMVEGICDPFGF
ncbi:MAG: DNA cytosine methyltransferase [Candidatus Dormibacteria bacterium]